jgi:hypothetical protein
MKGGEKWKLEHDSKEQFRGSEHLNDILLTAVPSCMRSPALY